MRDFLESVWGPLTGLYGELRFIKDKEVEQYWFRSLDDIPHFGVDDSGWDWYFGVLPRRRQEGTADACIDTTRVLWADVDAKSHPSKTAALYSITEFSIPASAIVDSGGGYHAYWFLRDVVPFTQAQAAMRYIAAQIGGDAVCDAPRILRIPGTHNHKYTPPRPVRLLRLDTTYRHDIGSFLYLVDEPRRRVRAAVVRERLPNLPAWLTDLIEQGAPNGSRSEQCFKVAVWMLRYGYTHDEIRAAFRDHPGGIGAKYTEKGRDGERWLSLTIAAAEDAG